MFPAPDRSAAMNLNHARPAHFTVACLVALAVPGAGATSTPQQGRLCPDVPAVVSPGNDLAAGLSQIARACQIPIGFEEFEGRTDRVALKTALPLRLAEPRAAVTAVLGSDLPYRLDEGNGVLMVRPAERGASIRTFLDHPVQAVPSQSVTIDEAFAKVLGVWLPSEMLASRRFGPAAGRGAPLPVSPRPNRRFEFAVAEGSTARDMLTSIVRAHGAAGWQVTYSDFERLSGQRDPSIGLYTFDNNSWSGRDTSIPRVLIDR